MTTIFDTMALPTGAPASFEYVTIELATFASITDDRVTVISSKRVQSNKVGYWSINLKPNAGMLPTGEFYILTYPGQQQLTIVVPASGGPFWVWDPEILVDVPAVPSPIVVGVVAVTGSTVDNTDPRNPVINADGSGAAATAQAAAIAAAAADATAKVAVEQARAEAAEAGKAAATALTAEIARATGVEAQKADLVAGKVPNSQLPAIATFTTHSVASQAAMLALTAAVGDVAIRTDLTGARFLLTALPTSTLGNWLEMNADPTAAVDSVNGHIGTVILAASDVGADAAGAAAAAQAAAIAAAATDATTKADSAQAAAISAAATDATTKANAAQTAAATDATTKVGAETTARIAADAVVEADIAKFAGGWGTAKVNPVTGCYHPYNYGPVGVDPATWTTAQQGAAVRAARDDAVAHIDLTNGYGQTLYIDRAYTIDHDPTITDPISGLNYCALKTWDYLTIRGAGLSTPLKLDNAQNCHVIAHPGRTLAGATDKITNFAIENLTIDGNKANQDGTHKHDGIHIPQHPGYQSHHVRVINADGKGIYSTANGDFGTGGTNLVRPVLITDMRVEGCAQWGYFLSATNRDTSYKGLWATGNGSPTARIAGNTVCATVVTPGNFKVVVDTFGPFTVALAGGDTPATIVTKINAVITTRGTASLTASGILMITSATSGTASRVYTQGTSDAWILPYLGLTTNPNNGDNNYRVGGNEYGGLFSDHSEAVFDGVFADQNLGDGIYIHNVDRCHHGTLHATRNNGVGIYVDAWNNSTGFSWTSSMNCQLLGYASYRTLVDSAEVYFDNGVEGYGITKNSTLTGLVAPGAKATGGALADNRVANWSVYVTDAITLTVGNDVPNPASLHLVKINPGDGGLLGVLRPPASYLPTAVLPLTPVPKSANYPAVRGDMVLCDTSGGTFTVTIPAASLGNGAIGVKWVKGAVPPVIALSGTDHFNTSTGGTTATPTLLAQGYLLVSDAASLWVIAADDLPFGALQTQFDGRYAGLASPALTGNPTAPTPASGDNTTSVATTAFVQAAVATLLDYRGAFDASGNTFPTTGGSGTAGAILKADFWIVSVAGTLGGTLVAPGDWLAAEVDAPGSTAGNWSIIEHDLGFTPMNATTTLDAIPNPVAARAMNGQKITGLANGTADTDAQAFGQRPFDAGKLTSPVTVSNLSGAQLLWAATTIPAAKLTVGSTFFYTLTGTLDNIVASGAFTFQTKVNGVQANSSAMPNQTGAASATFWSLIVYVTVIATGAGGSVNVTGFLTLPTAAAGTQGQKIIGNVQAVDLSAGLTIRADVNMATANAGNTVRAQAGCCAQTSMP